VWGKGYVLCQTYGNGFFGIWGKINHIHHIISSFDCLLFIWFVARIALNHFKFSSFTLQIKKEGLPLIQVQGERITTSSALAFSFDLLLCEFFLLNDICTTK
jgi:hypothetical protein